MSQVKYVMSGGLAFSEDKDMEKLRRFSLKGWHVSAFKFMGFRLEKGQCSDYIYSVDYRSLKEEETAEYFDFFFLLDGRILPQKERFTCFGHPLVQSPFTVIVKR